MKPQQTKLTLRLEDDLIKAAKKYSKAHGKSLSQLVADYLLILTKKPLNDKTPGSPPITRALKGILRKKGVSEKDYKKYLEDKYK